MKLTKTLTNIYRLQKNKPFDVGRELNIGAKSVLKIYYDMGAKVMIDLFYYDDHFKLLNDYDSVKSVIGIK